MNNKYASMSSEEYIRERLDDQFDYFDKKSSRNQTYYKLLKRIEIILLALIPLVTILPCFPDDIYTYVKSYYYSSYLL